MTYYQPFAMLGPSPLFNTNAERCGMGSSAFPALFGANTVQL